MKIYIAAPFCRKSEARDLRTLFRARNYTVTSRWIDCQVGMDDGASTEHMRQAAIDDLDDLEAADVVVFLNYLKFVEEGRGGKHFECGYALARGKHLIIVGQKSNAFHFHPSVYHCFSNIDLFDYLKGLEMAHV